MRAPSATPTGAEADGRSSAVFLWQVAAIGGAVYVLALLATLPARVALPRGLDTAGTVWNGEAALGSGHVAGWHASLLDSLGAGGVAGRWTIDGPGSALQGAARWRPFGGVALDAVKGRAGWPLVALAAPSLPFACDFGVQVALDRIDLAAKRQGVAGTVTGEPGNCTSKIPGATRIVPRLVASFTARDGRTTGLIAPWANRALHLVDMTIENGVVRLHTSAAGAALVPGSSGPSDLEVEL